MAVNRLCSAEAFFRRPQETENGSQKLCQNSLKLQTFTGWAEATEPPAGAAWGGCVRNAAGVAGKNSEQVETV